MVAHHRQLPRIRELFPEKDSLELREIRVDRFLPRVAVTVSTPIPALSRSCVRQLPLCKDLFNSILMLLKFLPVHSTNSTGDISALSFRPKVSFLSSDPYVDFPPALKIDSSTFL